MAQTHSYQKGPYPSYIQLYCAHGIILVQDPTNQDPSPWPVCEHPDGPITRIANCKCEFYFAPPRRAIKREEIFIEGSLPYVIEYPASAPARSYNLRRRQDIRRPLKFHRPQSIRRLQNSRRPQNVRRPENIRREAIANHTSEAQ